ncbi:MAG: STT3 domain-containing protein [Nanoarchaeota archaeon]|nr:STT3 domain-containing protein [Nanoarchaeota archaeon]
MTDSADEFSLNKEELEKRKQAFFKKLKEKKSLLVYFVFAIIAWFGYNIRVKNLPLLKDKIPLALDPHAFLRYAQYILEHGHLMAVDTMRYHPFGYSMLSEFKLLSYFMVYLYKFLHFFSSAMTLEKAVILYPPITFVVGLIFFFLLIRKLFDWRIALLSSAFLTVLPAYLYRTMAGFSDKEALAMAFMFMGLYFLVSAWFSKKNLKKAMIHAFLAGFATGLMGLVWGGVNFLFLTMGSYTLIQIFLNKFDKKDFYIYTCWLAVLIITLHFGYPERFTLSSFLYSFTSLIMIFAWLVGLFNYLFIQLNLFQIRKKINGQLPYGIFCIIVPLILGILFISFKNGFSFIFTKLSGLYIQMVEPFGTTRWALTVAESHQPYFVDWIGQTDWKYLALMFIGAAILFYEAVKEIEKHQIILGSSCLAFLLLFTMSRYSSASKVFNGETNIAILAYVGSFLLFFGFLIYGYIKTFYDDREMFNSFKNIKLMPLFVFVWFLFVLVAARSAIRLLFLFAPITAIMVGYGSFKLFDYSKKYLKQDMLKIGAMLILLFVVGSLLFGFSKNVSVQASYTGPSYNIQWENAMSWVKENTPKEAVFAHWWDYGYWVQTGGERTTLSDGGNALGGVNHFIGRHVLTGQSFIEGLEFLQARNATHLLMISDEIGKYPAFSSIGADANYDRYSWIPTFNLDANQIIETRNATIYLYNGGTPVDHDIVYNNILFPAGRAAVAGAFLQIKSKEVEGPNGTKETLMLIDNPEIGLIYNGQQMRAPINCVYFNGKKIMYDNPNAINACVRVIPKIDATGQMNLLGAALYLSPIVANSNFARLFLMNEESEYFKLTYTDEDKGMPLAIYQGRLIGPLKIWEINYPENLTIPKEYYGHSIPEEVRKVKKF